jgi:hypothetical protein
MSTLRGPYPIRRIAWLTVLGWNALALAVLLVLVWMTGHPAQPDSGEDWSDLVDVILLGFGVAGLTVATAIGTVLARRLVSRRTSRVPGTVGVPAAIGWGSAATVIAWVATAAAAALALMAINLITSLGS